MSSTTSTARSIPGRKSEALILALVGYVMLWLTASSTSVGGYMTRLESLGTAYRIFYVSAFVIAAGIAGFAILLASKGRRTAGVLLMAAVLTVYSLFLNFGRYPGDGLLPKRFVEVNQQYTFMLSGVDVPGAELWVNGTKLGVLPLRTTLGKFRETVPQWTRPPADFETDLAHVWHGKFQFQEDLKRWTALELPQAYRPASRRDGPTTASSKPDVYYARVRYGGEWASFTGNGGGGSSGGGLVHVSYSIHDARLPLREKRLSELLNQVRVRDYRVDEPWAKALDTFGDDGWVAVRKLAQSEPAMMHVFDTLAKREWKLPQQLDEAVASAEFDRLCAEADNRRWYRTDDLTGRAVELLSEQLPLNALAERARKSIVDTTYLQYASWSFDGQPAFGTFQQGAVTQIPGAGGQTTSMGTGRAGPTFPPSAFALAHALSKIAAEPTPRGQACRELLAQSVIPELIRQHGDLLPASLAKTILGYGAAPEVADYLQRQYRKTRDSREWGDHLAGGGGDGPNRWLYYLAILNSPEARRFRQLNADAMIELADALVANRWATEDSFTDRVSFLFENPQAALSYWPRFCRSVKKEANSFDQLAAPWQYLSRLSDLATPAMYVDALVETQPGRSQLQIAMLALVALPPKTQEQIMTALTERLAKGGVPLNSDFVDEGTKGLLEAVKQQTGWTKDALIPNHQDQQHADYDLRGLLEQATPDRVQRIRSYLSEGQPQSPLVEMLAQQTQPELRKLALVGIRHYATPDRRQLLQRLTADPDPAVRQEAAAVAAELESLAKSDPDAFKS